jgi:hypothetical protein
MIRKPVFRVTSDSKTCISIFFAAVTEHEIYSREYILIAFVYKEMKRKSKDTPPKTSFWSEDGLARVLFSALLRVVFSCADVSFCQR